MSGEQLTGGAQANGLAAAGEANVLAAATCAGCGAPLVADQRYCLACGEPASPVRLAFLDVLQADYRPTPDGGTPVPPGGQVYAAYAPTPEPDGLLGALRRYSGLLALVGVLLASLLVGLLVGHWVSGGGSAGAGKQVVEVKIPGGIVAAAAPAATGSGGSGANGTSSGTSGGGSSGSKSGGNGGSHAAASAKTERAAEEQTKAEKEVKTATAPPPVKKKASSGTLQKLEHSTGRQHEKEVSSLLHGDEPVETH